jgi:hypothetical protein
MTRRVGVRAEFDRACAVAFSLAAFLVAPGWGTTVRADEAFRCELKESGSLSPTDARTAAQVICAQLRRASSGQGGFGVSVATLGTLVVVTVAREGTANSVSVQVEAVEEIPVAAVRIADALVRGEGFAKTQRVDNLLQGETRPALTKKGSIKFTVGVADVESAGHGARAAGFSVGVAYVSPRFALPAEMRFAWDDTQGSEPRLDLFSLSVGGRGYLSKRDISPFVGAGLGVLRLHAAEGGYPGSGSLPQGYFDAERFGVAPYIEAGLELLRLHRGRVALQVRADWPLGELKSREIEFSSWDYVTGQPVDRVVYPARSKYLVPISIGLTVAF